MKTCPRKAIREVNDLLVAYQWADKGRLEYLYPPEGLPAFVAEAIDLISDEFARKMTDA